MNMKKTLSFCITLLFVLELIFPAAVFAKVTRHSREGGNPTGTSEIPASAGMTKLKDLPRHAWEDTKHSFWGTNGILFLLGTGLSAAMIPADHNISNRLINDPILNNHFDSVLGKVISPYTIGGAQIVGYILARETNHPKFALAMEAATEAFSGAMALTLAGKFAIGRNRPNGEHYSMPSAHAAAVFSTASVLTDFYGWKAAIPSYGLASLVSFTRVDHRDHFVSDVLMGAVLGSAIGWGTAQFHKHEHPNYFIIPQVSSKQAGLSFVKVF